MKKLIIIVLVIIALVSFTACGNNSSGKRAASQNEAASNVSEQNQTVGWVLGGNSVQIPNPFIDYTTIEDAQKLAGFNMTIPQTMPEGYSKSAIRAIKSKMIEIIYLNGDSEIRIRKAIGNEDISGDYTSYKEEKETQINGVKVTMKGDNGKVNVAVWNDGGYVFSITVNCGGTGLDSTIISNMASSVK